MFCWASNYCANSGNIRKYNQINTDVFFGLMRDRKINHLPVELKGKALCEERREEELPFFIFLEWPFCILLREESHRKISNHSSLHHFKAKIISHSEVTFFFLLRFPPILVFCSVKDSYLKRQGLFNHKHNSNREQRNPMALIFHPLCLCC